ncbi:flagellar hook-length control protein FliK [Sphingomonas mollis]|uniref:Flagellar hook-length control protein FliK n=1 Tax=Sphingomonas mollis TaxID=2795726 RepID=A0ABS0XPU9_9SPHN|nr:flagellar hook-length control protein FliK [Sphingomonas sp. BT553]MBJ6122064.1 flagellar hook-length control protein FliK [Sphingomonas sp. BT553]
MATSAPHVGNAMREEGRMTETGPVNAQPASFANLVTHTEKTAAPAPTAAAPAPPAEPRVAAQPGRMGQEMGVAIARHAATGGGEAMTVRLDPVEFGRIEVTLSFDDSGTIRAVVAAESPAALDLLRRDSADLGRSLAEAGIRSDAQSFRFDTRQGSADGSGQGGQRWRQQSAAGTRTIAQATDDNPEPVYRPLRTQGRVDLMA